MERTEALGAGGGRSGRVEAGHLPRPRDRPLAAVAAGQVRRGARGARRLVARRGRAAGEARTSLLFACGGVFPQRPI